MNHEENTKAWIVGDIVIHDCDAKDHDRLMVVIKKRKSREFGHITFVTKYLNPLDTMHRCVKREYKNRQIPKQYTRKYENTIAYLHDPARFGIEITENDRIAAEVLSR
jgi:hypothetical protein